MLSHSFMNQSIILQSIVKNAFWGSIQQAIIQV